MVLIVLDGMVQGHSLLQAVADIVVGVDITIGRPSETGLVEIESIRPSSGIYGCSWPFY